MEKRHHIKDPGSAITHFIGMLMAIFAAVPLLIKWLHMNQAGSTLDLLQSMRSV